MTVSTFAELGLTERLLRALKDADYKCPTAIQQRAIPLLLDGMDLLGIAQTGTGKTAAFTLPLLQNLDEDATRPRRARRGRSSSHPRANSPSRFPTASRPMGGTCVSVRRSSWEV